MSLPIQTIQLENKSGLEKTEVKIVTSDVSKTPGRNKTIFILGKHFSMPSYITSKNSFSMLNNPKLAICSANF